jgi:sulfite reductase alpha subunit-like flavoprotein
MRACADEVKRLLADDDTFVCVCGHKRMEQGVLAVLEETCARGSTPWAALRERLRREGRLHIETY